MGTLKFSLRLNSPAFAGSVQKGTRKMEVVRGRSDEERLERVEPGYYPNDRFGLRVPAVRGVLEFWYRALLGAQRTPGVYEAQGRVFGSTALGQGLRIRYAGRPAFQTEELEAPHKFKDAFLYLGYGPIQTFKVPTNPGQPTPNRRRWSSYSPSGFRDAIGVSEGGESGVFRFVATGTDRQLRTLRRALILLHLFGGFGSRSRRGWGSVRVEADFIPSASSAKEFDEQLQALWAELNFDPPRERPRFSAFGPGARVVRTAALAKGYEAVLNDFYERFQATRLWESRGFQRSKIATDDHDLEWRDADSHTTAISGLPKRLGFGMPYSPRFSNRRSISYAQESRLNDQSGEGTGRRASPLFLKVHRLESGDHFGLALLLNGTFLGDLNEKIGAVGKDGREKPPDTYEAIHEFLSPTSVSPSRDRLREWTEIKLPGIEETCR